MEHEKTAEWVNRYIDKMDTKFSKDKLEAEFVRYDKLENLLEKNNFEVKDYTDNGLYEEYRAILFVDKNNYRMAYFYNNDHMAVFYIKDIHDYVSESINLNDKADIKKKVGNIAKTALLSGTLALMTGGRLYMTQSGNTSSIMHIFKITLNNGNQINILIVNIPKNFFDKDEMTNIEIKKEFLQIL